MCRKGWAGLGRPEVSLGGGAALSPPGGKSLSSPRVCAAAGAILDLKSLLFLGPFSWSLWQVAAGNCRFQGFVCPC